MEPIKLKPYLRTLYDQGVSLRSSIGTFLSSWPTGSDRDLEFDEAPDDFRRDGNALITDVRKWFNLLKAQVLAHLLYDQQYVYYLLRQAEAAIKKNKYRRPYPESMPSTIGIRDSHVLRLLGSTDDRKSDIEVFSTLEEARKEALSAMDSAISLIESVPDDAIPVAPSYPSAEARSFTPNSAFILMWMDPGHPELDDVCNAIKEVCQDFGIRALRADDVQHEDRITEVVLSNIAESEFLIADLTGERPNVYYEVGFAHALGKRPILYRKAGTRLHFDLSVHNVREYKNITELKMLLKARFEAITGRLES